MIHELLYKPFYQKLNKYISPELLILDELGLKKLNQNSVDDFYEVISRRYENKSIITPSNSGISFLKPK